MYVRYVVPVISDIGISVATGIIISFPLLYVRELWRICLCILVFPGLEVCVCVCGLFSGIFYLFRYSRLCVEVVRDAFQTWVYTL